LLPLSFQTASGCNIRDWGRGLPASPASTTAIAVNLLTPWTQSTRGGSVCPAVRRDSGDTWTDRSHALTPVCIFCTIMAHNLLCAPRFGSLHRGQARQVGSVSL